MKTFLAPNGEYISAPDGKVTTFGLSKEQNALVIKALPTKGYELLDTDAPTDLIAISASALIINATALDEATAIRTVAVVIMAWGWCS